VPRKLAIGFGNLYRRDDGVGPFLINELRTLVGREPLADDEDGFDDLGHEVDTIVVHQLVPELATTMADYDLVAFLDAHITEIEEPVLVEELECQYRNATVGHQMHPCALLALVRDLYHKSPKGVLISVRGHDWDFGLGLSDQTAGYVPEAMAALSARMLGDESTETA